MYYGDRYVEFDERNLLPLARDVALAFCAAPKRRLGLAELNAVLARHGEDRAGMKAFLVAKGYIWQDADGSSWTLSIPSLMGYMIEQTAP